MTALRPTRAEISLDALRHNLATLRQLVGPGVGIMAVVKADAYGHGGVAVARALEAERVDWLGVALPEEGLEVRAAGVATPILCLGGFWPGQEHDVVAAGLTPAIYRVDQLDTLNAAAAAAGKQVAFHLKVDTGMGRLGVPAAALDDFVSGLGRFTHCECEGLMTHFASSDVPGLIAYSEQQLARYHDAAALLERHGIALRWRHLANSATTHAFPEARGNLVRPGATLYGFKRDVLAPRPPDLDLRPVMRLRSTVEFLKRVGAGESLGYGCTFTTARDSIVATIPIGYADGVRRALSNCGQVLVHGSPAPIIGRVSMDLTLIDVTDIDGVSLGDEVVLFGEDALRVEHVAATAGTISYEVTCGVSKRVPRVYAG